MTGTIDVGSTAIILAAIVAVIAAVFVYVLSQQDDMNRQIEQIRFDMKQKADVFATAAQLGNFRHLELRIQDLEARERALLKHLRLGVVDLPARAVFPEKYDD